MRWLLAAVLLLAACDKKGADNSRPKPISAAERKRGEDACNLYVARLCDCARSKPALAERCELKKAKPEALQLALEVDDNASATAQDIFLAQESARQVIAKCIEENAALDAEGCP